MELTIKKSNLTERLGQIMVKLINNYTGFDFRSILQLQAVCLYALEEFRAKMSPFYLGNEKELIENYGEEG